MRKTRVTRQKYKNNGMESAPEMDMPAEKIYEQSVLKQKQRDQCYWMTVTAGIIEHVILGWHSHKRIPKFQHSMPTPPACTEAHRGPGHQPVLQLPLVDRTERNPTALLSTQNRLDTQPRRFFGWQQHSALGRKPPKVQVPQTLCSSIWVITRQKAWHFMLWVHNSQNVYLNKLPFLSIFLWSAETVG